MAITKIKTIYIAADDVAAAADFYAAVLGMPIRFRDGDRWVQFETEGAGFAIASREEAGAAAQSAVIVFAATDEQDHARMLAAGAVLAETRDMGDHGLSRTYRDPSGNFVQLLWKR